MIKTKYFLLTLLLSAFLSAGAFATSFVEGIEDIPLMDGLIQQKAEENVSFGNEESRFIETYLSSKTITFKQVEKFYTDTLPQLGWKLDKKDKNSLYFFRDGEVLEIVRENGKSLLIRVTLKSKG